MAATLEMPKKTVAGKTQVALLHEIARRVQLQIIVFPHRQYLLISGAKRFRTPMVFSAIGR
jgi:hypothetical protein